MSRSRLPWHLVFAVELHAIAFLTLAPGDRQSVASVAPEAIVDVEEPPAPLSPEASPGRTSMQAPSPPRHRPPARQAPPAAAASAIALPDVGEPLPVASATVYPGGLTSSDGTSLAPGGGGGGGGAPDRSRPARRRGTYRLDCAWPDGSELQTDAVYVRVVVEVDPDGSPVRARVVDDPGHGFGEAARACAMTDRYVPGLGADGRPARSWSAPWRLLFDPFMMVPRANR